MQFEVNKYDEGLMFDLQTLLLTNKIISILPVKDKLGRKLKR